MTCQITLKGLFDIMVAFEKREERKNTAFKEGPPNFRSYIQFLCQDSTSWFNRGLGKTTDFLQPVTMWCLCWLTVTASDHETVSTLISLVVNLQYCCQKDFVLQERDMWQTILPLLHQDILISHFQMHNNLMIIKVTLKGCYLNNSLSLTCGGHSGPWLPPAWSHSELEQFPGSGPGERSTRDRAACRWF